MDQTEKISVTALIAERRIREAMNEGQFDNLPGRGRPQQLEDLSHLPEEMRLAYTVLKNSGFLEGGADGGAESLSAMMRRAEAEAADCGRLEKLKFMLNRRRPAPEAQARQEALESADPSYLGKLLEKM